MSERARGWRKLAQATWVPPKDPQFYGEMELDAGPLLTHLAEARARTNVPVTVTHVVAKAVAYALTATFDHRYVDGLHAARFADAVRRFLADPSAHDA